jgi:hypothetical protein
MSAETLYSPVMNAEPYQPPQQGPQLDGHHQHQQHTIYQPPVLPPSAIPVSDETKLVAGVRTLKQTHCIYRGLIIVIALSMGGMFTLVALAFNMPFSACDRYQSELSPAQQLKYKEPFCLTCSGKHHTSSSSSSLISVTSMLQ